MISITGSKTDATTEEEFGYSSIAGIVTVPPGLGETAKTFNGGDCSQFIGSVGFRFSY